MLLTNIFLCTAACVRRVVHLMLQHVIHIRARRHNGRPGPGRQSADGRPLPAPVLPGSPADVVLAQGVRRVGHPWVDY